MGEGGGRVSEYSSIYLKVEDCETENKMHDHRYV